MDKYFIPMCTFFSEDSIEASSNPALIPNTHLVLVLTSKATVILKALKQRSGGNIHNGFTPSWVCLLCLFCWLWQTDRLEMWDSPLVISKWCNKNYYAVFLWIQMPLLQTNSFVLCTPTKYIHIVPMHMFGLFFAQGTFSIFVIGQWQYETLPI